MNSNTAAAIMPTAYLSFDIEADGPSPAHNSMLSLGIAGLTKDKMEVFTWQKNFYARPGKKADPKCMTEFWAVETEAWAFVNTDRVDPIEGFKDLVSKLAGLRQTHKIEWVAWPSAYDWQWLNCYYQDMIEADPSTAYPYLGFKATCASTIWKFYMKSTQTSRNQENLLWDKFSEGVKGNHNSLMDARSQGLRFINLMNHAGAF